MSATTRFGARFDSECHECGGMIHEGEDAGFVRGEDGIRCDECLLAAENEAAGYL